MARTVLHWLTVITRLKSRMSPVHVPLPKQSSRLDERRWTKPMVLFFSSLWQLCSDAGMLALTVALTTSLEICQLHRALDSDGFIKHMTCSVCTHRLSWEKRYAVSITAKKVRSLWNYTVCKSQHVIVWLLCGHGSIYWDFCNVKVLSRFCLLKQINKSSDI